MPEGGLIPQRTLALVLGASRFPRAPALSQGRAFYNSAEDVSRYLQDPRGLGLPRENLKSLFDDNRSPSDQLLDIGDFLQDRARTLTSQGNDPRDLIVYYVGHGLFAGSEQGYCLAVLGTAERSEGPTSIRVSDFASVIKDRARFLRKLLILDCCFSAAAYKEFQSGPLHVARAAFLNELPKRGTVLLCSASAQDPSLAPIELSHTMFSDALLNSLRQGSIFFGPMMSVSELGDLVKTNLRNAYPNSWVRPEVHSPDQREGDVADVPVFPNPASGEQKRGEMGDRRPVRDAIIRTANVEREAPNKAPVASKLAVYCTIVAVGLAGGSAAVVSGNVVALTTEGSGWLEFCWFFVCGILAGGTAATTLFLLSRSRAPMDKLGSRLCGASWMVGWALMDHAQFDWAAGVPGGALIISILLLANRKRLGHDRLKGGRLA